jgi:hypothetical protein
MLATLLAFMLGAAPTAASKASAEDGVLVSLLQRAAELLEDQSTLRSGVSFLQTEEKGASPEKTEFRHRLRDLLSTAPEWSRTSDPTPALKELSQLLNRAVQLWPDDEKVQVEILSTRVQVMNLAPSANQPEFERAFSQQANDSGKRFPRSAKVHFYRGKYGWILELPPVERMRELKRCLQLDPTLTYCRRTYEAEAKQYRLPACGPDTLTKDIALYSEEAGGSRMVTGPDGTSLHISSKPVVTTKDILLVQDGSTDGDTTESYCDVAVKAEAKARVEEVTARLGAMWKKEPQHFVLQHFALMVGDKVLVAPVVHSRIGGGVFRVSTSDRSTCAQLCRGPMTVREIPEDARLP